MILSIVKSIITVMEFHNQIQINAPYEFVAPYIRRSENFDKWQDRFISATLLSGKDDKEGAQTRLLYKSGANTLELIETVESNNLPFSFKALYEHQHMDNTMFSSFEPIGDAITLYTTHVDYIELKGFMIKIMAKLFSGKFKKGPEDQMKRFKDYVEYKWELERSKL